MSGSLTPSPVTGSPPPARLSRWLSALIALLVIAGSFALGTQPAHAGSEGVGYWSGGAFLGAYNTDVDGRQAYCADLDAAAPYGSTSGPERITSLDSLSRQQLAELNYVMDRWGQSGDPNITAAVALHVWSVTSAGTYNSHGMSGDDYYVARAPASERGTILANLATMRQEAAVNAVTDPTLSLSLAMGDQYAGTLTVATHPAGLTGTATLTDAVFADGSSSRTIGAGAHPIMGTPADGVPAYQVGASMSIDAAGYGAALDLYVTPGGGKQRLIAAVSGSSTGLSARAESPVIELDFQPEITTQVASRFVAEGDAFVDGLTVSVSKGTWIHLDDAPVEVTATGTLYGPFDEQPTEADTPPAGAPVAGTETVTLTGAGSYTSPGTIIAPESGFYTWVWAIDKDAHGANAKYLTDSFTDRFGQVTETSVVPFQPVAVSEADQRLAVPGDALTDTITVSSSNGAWLKKDGKFIPVVFEGTAYQVPGTLPPTQNAVIDAAAVPLGTVTVTADGPGVYTSPSVVAPSGGFVTWVWEVRKSSQPEWVRDYLANDWQDDYGINVETTSVRWPITVASLMREYNVHPDGRAFDVVTVSGFPANHGDFAGDGYWGADVDELRHTVYGPFATDTMLTDDLDLTTAPVLTELTTPARNGVYKLGYTDADQIVPTEPGFYVLVTTFAGDDRVQPYQSSPEDVLERFYVPPTGTEVPVSVITQATPEAFIGEPFSDTALVQGTKIPDGAYLVFRAYGPHPSDTGPVCEVPFFESDEIPVTQAGVYRSGTTSVDAAGNVYWIETLYDSDGEIIAEGECGAPGETTVVKEQPEELIVKTNAVPTVTLGDPAHDVATVTGTVPDGARLMFEAYRQDGDTATCTPEELVFTSTVIELDGPGEYRSDEVIFDRVGVYYWVETVTDADGTILHRGVCGAPDETTTVTDSPDEPGKPGTPGELAHTGGGDWWPLGLAGGLIAAATGGVLLFGRRLAITRERNGHVREEDESFEEFKAQFEGAKED
ncbi:hypothetical protein ICV35_12210 [Rhodococcus ruber]|uniref:hypothetical protein n=1 Tax=Rhodococcus ruber TaxID=1830 RepID=UPI0017872BD3|nr:hypothetical protein [Rhodococcus ruber]MBD8054434.1 hypothetical protein [Rhodococcus ruber]